MIVLDVIMPVMDGWDFRAEQLADPSLRHIPVVVISACGFARTTLQQQFKTPGVVSKPLELGTFVQTLREACGPRFQDSGRELDLAGPGIDVALGVEAKDTDEGSET